MMTYLIITTELLPKGEKVTKRDLMRKNHPIQKLTFQNKSMKMIAKYKKFTCKDLMAVMLKFQEVKVVEDIDPSLYEKKLKNKYQYFNNLFFIIL